MIATVHPSVISGDIIANASKSHAQRAIALAGLAHGISILHHPGDSDDVRASAGVASAFAQSCEFSPKKAAIAGNGRLQSTIWHCGESGFSLRMFTAIAGLFEETITLHGHGSLTKRPVEFMRGPMEFLGTVFESVDGYLPLSIKGRMRSGSISVDGSLSSQFLSGLLIALPLLSGDSRVSVAGLRSKPYIDLTISTMQQFGVSVSHQAYEQFMIEGNQSYRATDLMVEGDWSGMAFTLVAAALCGSVRISNLQGSSTQSDRAIIEALRKCGAEVSVGDHTITCAHKNLNPFEFDATDAPDLFPPLVALAAHCNGVSRITGVDRLKHKESDRFKTLQSEFAKLNVPLSREGNVMLVIGGSGIPGATVDAHNDHRIAMAIATAALSAEDRISIRGAECVRKSYARFFDDLDRLGANVDVIEE